MKWKLERIVEEEWEIMKRKIENILKRVNKIGKGKEAKGWWDKKCEEKKREVRKAMRK